MASQSSTSYYQSEFKFNDDRACKKCPVDIFSDGASMPRWSLLDKETSLYYYGARYYDPSLSVWLSVDPLVEKFPSFSPYNYTMNNPINMVDPDGRAPKEDPEKGWLGRAISTVKGWFSSKSSGYSPVVQSKPKIESFELTLISYEPGESCIGENTNMQTSSDDYSWFSDLFGREPEGMRIWGEGTGGNSTRDDGYSSGPTVETSDLRGMSTSNIRD